MMPRRRPKKSERPEQGRQTPLNILKRPVRLAPMKQIKDEGERKP